MFRVYLGPSSGGTTICMQKLILIILFHLTSSGRTTICMQQLVLILFSWLPFVLVGLFQSNQDNQSNKLTLSELQPTSCNVSWFIYFYRCFACIRRFLRTSSGAQNCTYRFRYCQSILLLAARVDEIPSHLIHASSQQQYWLTIPGAVYTVLCSWWWADEPPETCRASVEINKSRNLASCWL